MFLAVILLLLLVVVVLLLLLHLVLKREIGTTQTILSLSLGTRKATHKNDTDKNNKQQNTDRQKGANEGTKTTR
jgi:cadmium resistance protein CadD (predicted permease)